MSLIPVDDELLVESLLHDVIIHRHGTSIGKLHLRPTRKGDRPTVAGQTIRWGVNCGSGPLALVIADGKEKRGSLSGRIFAAQVVILVQGSPLPVGNWQIYG